MWENTAYLSLSRWRRGHVFLWCHCCTGSCGQSGDQLKVRNYALAWKHLFPTNFFLFHHLHCNVFFCHPDESIWRYFQQIQVVTDVPAIARQFIAMRCSVVCVRWCVFICHESLKLQQQMYLQDKLWFKRIDGCDVRKNCYPSIWDAPVNAKENTCHFMFSDF